MSAAFSNEQLTHHLKVAVEQQARIVDTMGKIADALNHMQANADLLEARVAMLEGEHDGSVS